MRTTHALEQQARREARRVYLVSRKSRWRRETPDNQGGFQLFDPSTGFPVFGFQYELTAEDVISHCRNLARSAQRDDSSGRQRHLSRGAE